MISWPVVRGAILVTKKNDGYLSSTRTLFQCYAPNELAAKETIKKVHEDFQGALKYWKEYFDEWTFVHNAPDGRLAPNIIKGVSRTTPTKSEA